MEEDWQEDIWNPPSGETQTADSFELPTEFGGKRRSTDTTKAGFTGFGGSSSERPRNRSCFKCGEEGHMSRECPTGDGGTQGRRGQYRGSGGERHQFKGCHESFGSGGEGDPFTNPTGGGSGKKCFKCGELGHISRDCSSAGGLKKGCHKCSQKDHIARDCPNPENTSDDKIEKVPIYIPNEVNVEDLFDTGIVAGSNFEGYDNIPVKVTGEPPIHNKAEKFEEMNLRTLLYENIVKAGYLVPTPVQKYTIPNVMSGRDIMACAQTGSGKTAAFLLPMLHYILKNECPDFSYKEVAQPTGLVVCPTRELALQIMNEARKFSCGSIAKCNVAYGGVASFYQLKCIFSGCHILVATPGRLKDFVNKGKIAFNSIKFLVLDEADRMLDMGFLGALKELLEHPTMPPPGRRTTLMFSATFPNEIQLLAGEFLNQYLYVVVGTVGAANTDVKQEVKLVPKFEKREMLVKCITEILATTENEKILVFVEQKRMTDFVGSYLCENGFRATTIHGDRYQEQREAALASFRRGTFNILVATAVAARGLDIKGINIVINYDLPKEIDEYVHRIGRTGRVGNQGCAISFYDGDVDGNIGKALVRVLSEANQDVPLFLSESAQASENYYTPDSHQYASADIREMRGIQTDPHEMLTDHGEWEIEDHDDDVDW